MFAVFEKNLLTDQGKAIVCDHAYRCDAWQVYIELKTYSLESTKASLESARLLEYIVGTSIDDSTWKGMAEGFILHWLALKNQADQTKAITGKELTFRQYCKLLQSAAAQSDTRFKPKRHDTHPPARCSVYNHDFFSSQQF